MAKKIYHISIEESRQFISQNKSELNKLLTNKHYFEYTKYFGKVYFNLQIEKFIHFFKINKDLQYSLKTINHLSNNIILNELFLLLNFSQFDFVKYKVNEKEFFYGLCYIMYQENIQLFEKLLHKFFLHFHATLNNNTNIQIDFKEMTISLANSRKISIKESFGEDEAGAFFILKINEQAIITQRGTSIKTLRKKAYKNMFYYLLDNEIVNDKEIKRDEAYETMSALKEL
ncbi:MAG: hypothetical protein ACNI3C_00510 [Candidatus Marinarcus sp.]|uniref:hypothetical protein n=1 Tax=Candidatus Marinarcus sp. TaxID=3100987 RepID=UPI003B004B60